MKRNEKQMIIVCHQRPDAFASIHRELFDVISPKCLPWTRNIMQSSGIAMNSIRTMIYADR